MEDEEEYNENEIEHYYGDESLEMEEEIVEESGSVYEEDESPKRIYHLKKEGSHFSLDVIEEDYDSEDYLEEDQDGDLEGDNDVDNKRYYFIPSR